MGFGDENPVSRRNRCDSSHFPPQREVCKWLANSVTKFGASAAVVADQEEAKKALSSMAEELIKAFTALVGTLLAMSSGAGADSRVL